MPIVIDQRLVVSAPCEIVWETITDFGSYAEWNPFVVSCRSTLEVGSTIEMRVKVFDSFAQPQRERVFEHEPGRSFCYGVPSLPLGALRSRRSHSVEPTTNGHTVYNSHFELFGWLAPVVQALFGTRLDRGFDSMSQAIRARAEALERRRSQAPR